MACKGLRVRIPQSPLPLQNIKGDLPQKKDLGPWATYYSGKMHKQNLESEGIKKISVFLKRQKAVRILDFACGTGRHTAFMAARKFDVYGLDSARPAIAETRRLLKKGRLKAHLKVHDMNRKLPYKDKFFDAVIIVRALYHAKLAGIKKIAKDIERIVKPGGYIYTESDQSKYKRFYADNEVKLGIKERQVETRTWLSTAGPWKGGYYHYFSASELKTIFPNCKILAFSFKKGKYSMLVEKK